MASGYLMLTVLLTSQFSSWECTGAVLLQDPSSTTEGDPVLARGLHPHPPHLHNSTFTNKNGTSLWFQSFTQLMNTLLNEMRPASSSPHHATNPPQAPTTSAPLTTTESSDWDDWDLDDFHSCGNVMQSVIRRLSTSRS